MGLPAVSSALSGGLERPGGWGNGAHCLPGHGWLGTGNAPGCVLALPWYPSLLSRAGKGKNEIVSLSAFGV